MNKIRLLFASYFVLILGLFFYSFTQVDLSLTLSQASILLDIEKHFQYVGYFNRPLSTLIFLIILGLLLVYYLAFIYLSLKNRITVKQIWKTAIATAVILSFSYNAFSYDLFNYIFDAKIITHYNLNPYMYKALDFPNDPMLSFMHWTHRTYPYGPLWLVLTVPFSFLGFGLFLPTFFLFKMFVSATFLGTLYFIQKIVGKISPKYQAFSMAFFALSPFVLIEALVDSHNDMPMMFFAVLSIYLALNKKWILSVVAVVLSALTKQATVFMVPVVFLYALAGFRRFDISFDKFVKLCVVSMIGAILYIISQVEIQPWYFLWVFPLVALLKPNKYLFFITTGFSIGLLLRYAPFLYQGDWNGFVPTAELYLTIGATLAGLLIAVILDFTRIIKKRN